MKSLALTLPGFTNPLPTPPGLKPEFNKAGDLLSGLFNVALLAVGFLMLFWISWGIFQYIFAGGNKESLAKARSRIIWAIVGSVIVLLSFSISRYVFEFASPNIPAIQNITPP